MKIYWEYLKYIIEHKINVGIECCKMGLYAHAIFHDISKFLPSEFIPYAKYFYDEFETEDDRLKAKANFDLAWLRHQNRNGHHWDHWIDATGVAFEMPIKYIKYMIADWRGMSRKFGDTVEDYYTKNRDNMNLHPETIKKIEDILSL